MIEPPNLVGGISFESIILWLLSLATVIFVLEAIGMLPPRVARWLAHNRLGTTIRALKILGVKVNWDGDKPHPPNILSRAYGLVMGKEPQYVSALNAMLAQHTLDAKVDVGQRRTFEAEYFIDVIGNTTDPEVARNYARFLYTHLEGENLLDFDFVATPKDGAPLLGYEFACLAEKPLVLGVCDKGNDSTGKIRSHLVLDFPHHMSLETRTGLLVDDSTTGGRKMLALAKALRAEGATIKRAAVLFEPIGKGARKLLRENEIELTAIVPGPQGRK